MKSQNKFYEFEDLKSSDCRRIGNEKSRSPQIAFLCIFSEMDSEKQSLIFSNKEKKLKSSSANTQLVLVLGKKPENSENKLSELINILKWVCAKSKNQQ